MGGFVDNYMRQPPTTPAVDPYSVMHYFTPDQVPVISQLARAFGVSDRWHASAPCQTWPNRFFAHTGTANGYVDNSPTHFPYEMETVFNRLADAGQSWRIYFHDFPQTATLAKLWGGLVTSHFLDFSTDFIQAAAAGNLPAYSFIEPRYFTDLSLNNIPNDEHPPHNVAYGERLLVDYAGQTVEVADGSTGELRTAQVFVAVLGASNYTYAEATPAFAGAGSGRRACRTGSASTWSAW
jgi:phospholipase C